MENNELKKIKGGAFNIGIGLFIGGAKTFIIGLVDGYVRPLACR